MKEGDLPVKLYEISNSPLALKYREKREKIQEQLQKLQDLREEAARCGASTKSLDRQIRLLERALD